MADEEYTGRWVHQGDASHICRPPEASERLVGSTLEIRVATGQPGDLWRCSCGRLWVVTKGLFGPWWARAGLWRRLKARRMEAKRG